MKKTPTLLTILFLIGCATLSPISGGVLKQNGTYILNESKDVQIEIVRSGLGTQLGRVEVILKNNSSEPIQIDYMQTVIMTDTGEQVTALGPEEAAASISIEASDVMREGIGKVMLQPRGFISGAFFFKPPSQPFRMLTFKFKGIQGSPELSLGTGG